MANRRMGGSFDGGYARRQGSDGPFSNQSNFNQGQRQQNSFDQGYNRGNPKGDGFYGDNRGAGNNRGSYGNDFGQQRGGDNYSRRSDDWGRGNNPFGNERPQQGGGNMGMMGAGPNQGSGQGGQQVVMVVPQGNAGSGGIVLPVQGTPNPFAMPRQQPMQVIVGNLPAFNADLGQQILAAASARPQYGQGMMGNAPMGIMNQQQQQQQPQQRYDRSVAEGGNRSNNNASRFSRQSNQRPGAGRSATLIRRTDTTSGAVSKVARTSVTSATMRGNRKRTILRDRHGVTDEVDKKRARTTPNNQANKARNAVTKAKAANQKKNNKKTPEKKADDEKDKAEVKEEADKSEDAEVKEDEEKAEGEEGKEGEKKPSKYDELPTSLLVCKVCQKVMSDGGSLESHLSGRAHASMVKILEERFTKRAELLMFESKISEQELGIERDRQRRAGKGHGGKNSKNFCKMCDCNYSVNWGTHKGGLPHRVLKEYLHPTCRYCATNFVHRMDWVNHLNSVNHLNKVVELKNEGIEIPEAESPSQDDLFCIYIDIGRDEKAPNIVSVRPADYRIPPKEDLKEMLKEENGELVIPEGEIEIPKEYDENTKYGEDAILKTEGACCKVCRNYIANVNDIEGHLKSKAHYGMYVGFLKKMVKYREHQKAEAEKKAKEEAERLEKEKKAAEEAAKAAAEAPKTEAGDEVKTEAMETEAATVEQKSEEKFESVNGQVKPEDVEMAEVKDEKAEVTATEPAKTDSPKEAPKAASPAKEIPKAASPVKEAPKAASPAKEAPKAASPAPKAASPAPKAASPAKTAQPARGGQQGRGRGGGGANRGGMATPRGRGGQTPQRGGGTPRGGQGMRGRGGRGGGGGDSPNWRGGRGGQRGGRGNFR